MPNWVTHRVVMTGPEAVLHRFLEDQIAKNRDGDDHLDFNRVIPKPEALEGGDAGSDAKMAWVAWYGPDKVEISTDMSPMEAIIASTESLDTHLAYPWVIEAGVKDRKGFQRLLLKRNKNAKKLADQRARNLKNYGAADWYDWATENWGTKWNSSALRWETREPERFEFLFNTAWSPPEPIFLELSRIYPEIRFDISSFDQCWNFGCQGYYLNGVSHYGCGEATPELYEAVYGEPPEEGQDE